MIEASAPFAEKVRLRLDPARASSTSLALHWGLAGCSIAGVCEAHAPTRIEEEASDFGGGMIGAGIDGYGDEDEGEDARSRGRERGRERVGHALGLSSVLLLSIWPSSSPAASPSSDLTGPLLLPLHLQSGFFPAYASWKSSAETGLRCSLLPSLDQLQFLFRNNLKGVDAAATTATASASSSGGLLRGHELNRDVSTRNLKGSSVYLFTTS